jgi:CheY-like chemotaxis protein
MLERRGYRVLEAADGQEALEVLGRPAPLPDVLLTDLVMPRLDGRQLIARCAEFHPSLPVVCMTGFAGDQDAVPAQGAAPVILLSKPFSSDALLAAVNAAAARLS